MTNNQGALFPKQDPITGLYLQHSNGCHKHPNCFTCPLPDCTWNDKKDKWEGDYVSNRGMDIKPEYLL